MKNPADQELRRCDWLNQDPLYQAYHDLEWGVPVHDDQRMFEFILLESFQAGLSWFTILKKRENFREAFHQFDYRQIAQYGRSDVERLMENAGIIRNRLKILSAVNNAQRFLEIAAEWGSFCQYFWSFTNHQVVQNQPIRLSDVPAKTELSDKISKDLKKRGFKFIGSTTIYAHMQACGMVNDHQVHCFRHAELS